MPRKPRYYQGFPDRLRVALYASNLTQSEVSRKLRMSPSSVSEWLSGKRCPRINVVRKLAKVLSVPVEALTGGDKPDNLGGGIPRLQEIPVFRVAASLPPPKRLGDAMSSNFSPKLWRCRLCGNHYELDEMAECPVDGEPRPGPADPVVVARKRVEKLKVGGELSPGGVEAQVGEVLDELQQEGKLPPGAREGALAEIMARFGEFFARREARSRGAVSS